MTGTSVPDTSPPTTPPAPGQGSGTPLLIWTCSALAACLAAGYGALFTVVGDFRDTYGISEWVLGWVIGIGFIAAFFAQLVLAPIGDRGHARTLMLGGVAVNVVGLLLVGFGTSGWLLLIGRIVSGLAIGAAEPALRRIVSLADPDNLGRNLGRLLAASVFGFATGPALAAALVGPFGLPAPFVVLAVASVVILSLTFRVRPAETAGPAETDRWGSPGPRLALDLLRFRPFAGAVLLGAGGYAMIGAFDALWDLVHTDLGTAHWVSNLGITLFALPLILLAPFGGRLAQQLDPFRISAAGLVAAAVFMAAYGVVPNGYWMFGVVMIHAVTDGLTIGAAGVAVSLTAPESRRAGAFGVLGAAQALAAGIVAPLIAGLYQTSGRTAAYGVAAAAVMVMTVGGLLLAGRSPLPVAANRAGPTGPTPVG